MQRSRSGIRRKQVPEAGIRHQKILCKREHTRQRVCLHSSCIRQAFHHILQWQSSCSHEEAVPPFRERKLATALKGDNPSLRLLKEFFHSFR